MLDFEGVAAGIRSGVNKFIEGSGKCQDQGINILINKVHIVPIKPRDLLEFCRDATLTQPPNSNFQCESA
jgi:hypothetical protein